MQNNEEIAGILRICEDAIDNDNFEIVSTELNQYIQLHPDTIDERFKFEIMMLMKQMDYKTSLREFTNLYSLSKVYHYCEKNYSHAGESIKEEYSEKELQDKDTIWCFWLQGWDKAPEIVKKCRESLNQLGKRVIELDKNNVFEIIRLPSYIQEKYDSGLMEIAHYSDAIRLELLTTRGGIWIDATVLISGIEQIKPVIDSEDLFMFRAGNTSEYIIFDNWFIIAKIANRLLESTKKMLYSYWENETKAFHYFLFHLFMTVSCKLYPEDYKRIPVFSNEPCHVLQYELLNQYSEKRWNQIIKMSDVHKLTYRIDYPTKYYSNLTCILA